jgi:hypothetical protein
VGIPSPIVAPGANDSRVYSTTPVEVEHLGAIDLQGWPRMCRSSKVSGEMPFDPCDVSPRNRRAPVVIKVLEMLRKSIVLGLHTFSRVDGIVPPWHDSITMI